MCFFRSEDQDLNTDGLFQKRKRMLTNFSFSNEKKNVVAIQPHAILVCPINQVYTKKLTSIRVIESCISHLTIQPLFNGVVYT